MADKFNLTGFLKKNQLLNENIGGYVDIKPVKEEMGTAMGEDDTEGTKNETSNVDRFEVIDHTSNGMGRALVKRGINVELSYQDDGKTLKVFLTDKAQ